VQRSLICDNGNPLEMRNSRVMVVVILILVFILHPPADGEIVQDGAGVDYSPGTGVVGAQRLEDGELPLHDSEDVLGAHRPQPGEPRVELRLPGVHKGLSVGIGLHEDITNRVAGVPRNEELPLALDKALHRGVVPDASVMVGSLPVGDDVQNEVLIVADYLDIDGVAHLPVEKILGDSSNRNHPRLLFELHDDTINTGKETRQTETRVIPVGRRSDLLVAGQLDHLVFDAAQLVGNSFNGVPGSRLGHSTAQPGDTGVMAATIEIQGQANLLQRCERPPTVVVTLQV